MPPQAQQKGLRLRVRETMASGCRILHKPLDAAELLRELEALLQ